MAIIKMGTSVNHAVMAVNNVKVMASARNAVMDILAMEILVNPVLVVAIFAQVLLIA
jgi:hypothetical protein